METLRDLRNAKVDVVTIGQYLQPSKKHLPVSRNSSAAIPSNIRCSDTNQQVSPSLSNSAIGRLVTEKLHMCILWAHLDTYSLI